MSDSMWFPEAFQQLFAGKLRGTKPFTQLGGFRHVGAAMNLKPIPKTFQQVLLMQCHCLCQVSSAAMCHVYLRSFGAASSHKVQRIC